MTRPDGVPRVLYIMGAARSGSTALGTAIGNREDVFFAGELSAWLRRGGVPNFGGTERDEFWRRVAARVTGADHLFGDVTRQTFEHSSSLPRWRARRRHRRRFHEITRALYVAIAAESGCDWIVDSSHYPLRARELRRIAGLDVHVALLVRDPRAVVASFARRDVDQPAKGKLASNLYLWVTHALAVSIYLRWPRPSRHLVRYEKFIADPDAVLARLPTGPGPAGTHPGPRELRTGLAFQGNRLLRQPSIRLAASTPVPRDRATTAVQLPWVVVFRFLDRRRT